MDKLIKARETINEVDKEIAALFEKRMEAVRLVAEYKKERGLPIFDFSRECEVVKNNLENVHNDEIKELYISFIKNTMEISRQYQQRILEGENTACSGVEGAFAKKLISLNTGKDSYEIVLERGAIKRASELFDIKGKVLIVTDSGVPEEYVRTVAEQFENSFIFTFPQGEQNKNFDTYKSICEKLLEHSFTRKDAVIAVGGGVAGDMAGFAASTYMRGIEFYNIPTTLLSQVDSSIGGKTAIDFGKVKNIIGAFYQPEKVIIDPEVLSTLSDRLIKNGLAESIKMGITFNRELFELFKKENYMDYIDRIIELSLLIKKDVVERDEKETSLRRSLNFGHTIGHAIEGATASDELYHGECVALGIPPMCDEKIRGEVEDVIKNIGLPTEYTFDRKKVEEIIRHDKKSCGDKICVVKCNEIGSFYFQELTVNEIMNLI